MRHSFRLGRAQSRLADIGCIRMQDIANTNIQKDFPTLADAILFWESYYGMSTKQVEPSTPGVFEFDMISPTGRIVSRMTIMKIAGMFVAVGMDVPYAALHSLRSKEFVPHGS